MVVKLLLLMLVLVVLLLFLLRCCYCLWGDGEVAIAIDNDAIVALRLVVIFV